jgi:hypothetical protein
MEKMKSSVRVLGALLLVIILGGCTGGQKQSDGEWIQLFNGKDLEGWTPKIKGYELGVNFGNTFRVEDGLLKIRYDEYENFGTYYAHLFYKDEFSHYIIRAEYRFVGDQCPGGPGWAFRNNGLMIHGQSAESMEVDQDFPVSIEVQLLGGDGQNPRSTANLCTPGTNVVINGQLVLDHCIVSSSDTFHGDQWVTVEVEVHGGEVIRHFVNGEKVMEYNEPQLDERDKNYFKLLPDDGDKILRKGSISLQGESHPTDFRKIELKILE